MKNPGCSVLVTSQPHRSHIAVAYAQLQIVERLGLHLVPGVCVQLCSDHAEHAGLMAHLSRRKAQSSV
jgi:hypothetical protein